LAAELYTCAVRRCGKMPNRIVAVSECFWLHVNGRDSARSGPSISVRFRFARHGDVKPSSPGDLPRQEIVVVALAVPRHSHALRAVRLSGEGGDLSRRRHLPARRGTDASVQAARRLQWYRIRRLPARRPTIPHR